jgi:hypothetical protein
MSPPPRQSNIVRFAQPALLVLALAAPAVWWLRPGPSSFRVVGVLTVEP